MPISLRHIRHFLAVAEHGSTALAAHNLHVSQPAISISIRELEQLIGRQLFVRRPPHGLSLTLFGTAKLQQARLLAAKLSVFASVDSESDSRVGHVAFGYFTTLGPQHIPGILRRMLRRYPGIQVTPIEADLDELHNLLRSGRVELGLSYDLDPSAQLAVERVASMTPYALVPPRHALARQREVTVVDLAKEPLILIDLPSSRDFLLSVFRSENVEPRIGYRVRSIEMVVGMVANDLGVSVLVTKPASVHAYDGRRIVRRPLAHTRIQQNIVLSYAKRSALTFPARALAECIREQFGLADNGSH